MVKLICHGCGDEKDVAKDAVPKEFVCQKCGAVNVVSEDYSSTDAAACLPPKGFEWKLPAGKKTNAAGETVYVTAQGTEMTKKQFLETFGVDADIMIRKMREMGEKGVKGYTNTSTLGRKRKPAKEIP